MLQVQDLTQDRKTVTVEYKEHEFDVTFYPSKMTPALEEKANELWKQGTQLSALAYMLAEVLDSWDVFDGSEQLDTDVDTLKEFGAPILMAIINTIRDENSVGKEQSGSFGATS